MSEMFKSNLRVDVLGGSCFALYGIVGEIQSLKEDLGFEGRLDVYLVFESSW
jgi:hypothetical protein